MSVIYSLACINARLNAVVSTIGNGGSLVLFAQSTTISTIVLAFPCGIVNGGVLTFTGTLLDPSASGTGTVTGAIVKDGLGNTVVSGLTAGIPGTGADIIISNGLNSTFITTTQSVQLLSATITGS